MSYIYRVCTAIKYGNSGLGLDVAGENTSHMIFNYLPPDWTDTAVLSLCP